MKSIIKLTALFLVLSLVGCKNLDTTNENNPDREAVLSTGDDLIAVLEAGYVAWWQGVHGEHPAIGLSVAADAYGMSWGNFGAQRMGEEPRVEYNNRANEEKDYAQIANDPWIGCLSAVSSANDVLRALEQGVSIDNDGPQNQTIQAAAHLLRGLSWGYLALIFDQAIIVSENTDLEGELTFSAYPEIIPLAVAELEEAISLAETIDINFIHEYFNGVTLSSVQFSELCHAYAARFLVQWPRTETEKAQVDWTAALMHAEAGLTFNFAPEADGNFWQSYHQYVFAETGQGPFWARVDQRIIAALDPGQPARYPEVEALGEAPLANPMATSTDKRLETDFTFFANQSFPADRGEWHFSHYKHNRNISDPDFAGDGSTTGPMPVFLASDNDLLKAEALVELNRIQDAIAILNTGPRSTRGELPALSMGTVEKDVRLAIQYERAIELLGTAPMGLWFDRRRTGARQEYNAVDALGGLQMGTPAQLPVPATELRIHGMEPYNFGGEKDPEGIVPVF
jgi:hypothetical protein